MKRVLVAAVLSLHLVTVLSSANTCGEGCSCEEEDENSGLPQNKEEGLASAVGALTPLVAGGAGLVIYKVIRSLGSTATEAASSGGGGGDSSMPTSPRLAGKRGSWDPSGSLTPSTPYHSARRGSTPLSLLGEDDLISFGESSASPRLEHSLSRRTASRWL